MHSSFQFQVYAQSLHTTLNVAVLHTVRNETSSQSTYFGMHNFGGYDYVPIWHTIPQAIYHRTVILSYGTLAALPLGLKLAQIVKISSTS